MNWDSVGKPIANGLKAFTNNKYVSKYLVNPKTVTVSGLIALSIIGKDAVNCGFYTYQSLNNKEIPEKDRGFVAALDFANGIVNVVGQLLIIKPVERITGQCFDWLFTQKKGFLRTDCLKDLSKDERMMCKGGFKVVTSLLLCQIAVKRIFTPLIATPAAKAIVNKAKEVRRARDDRNLNLVVKSGDTLDIQKNKNSKSETETTDTAAPDTQTVTKNRGHLTVIKPETDAQTNRTKSVNETSSERKTEKDILREKMSGQRAPEVPKVYEELKVS